MANTQHLHTQLVHGQNVHEAIGSEAASTPEEGKPWGYYDRPVLAVVVMSDEDWADTLKRNKDHLEIMIAKTYWTTENLTPLRNAVK